MPSITIHVASRGTPRLNETPAVVGHMWITLDDGNGNRKSFGFSQNRIALAQNDNLINKLFIKGDIYHDDDTIYQHTSVSKRIELSDDAYQRIKDFSDDPEKHGFNLQYNAFTNSCIDFVWAALHAAGLNPDNFEGDLWPSHNIEEVNNIGVTPLAEPLWQVDPFTGLPWPGMERRRRAAPGLGAASAEMARAAARPRPIDPLALDLDGDGIETVGIDSKTPILFDHDGDGVRTGTGWLKPDDGWLAWDRDGNGIIDSGAELFGVDTLKSDGKHASDGFDALRDIDANQDGRIDAADPVFSQLRIWRDLNQDGQSQSRELTTLAQHQINVLHVKSSTTRKDLGNGNQQSAEGSFETSSSTSGLIANIDLASDSFHRRFDHRIPLSQQTLSLPTLRGSGQVRDLDEAISLNETLGQIVSRYAAEASRDGQLGMLDEFIEQWANTSRMQSLSTQAAGLAEQGVELHYSIDGLDGGGEEFDAFIRKLGIVERFMGFTYAGTQGAPRTTQLCADDGTIRIWLRRDQRQQICAAYDGFKMDIYKSLLPMTRFSGYFKLLLDGSQEGNFSGLEDALSSSLKEDAGSGLMDLVEFIESMNRYHLQPLGWNASAFLLESAKQAHAGERLSLTTAFGKLEFTGNDHTALHGATGNDILIGQQASDHLYGGAGDDLLFGQDGNDHLHGGQGNDHLKGQDGSDTLDGGLDDDILDGGTGDDYLYGGKGNDTYLFGRGHGRDTINNNNNAYWYGQRSEDIDTILFHADIRTNDIIATRNSDDLLLQIRDTDDRLRVQHYFSQDGDSEYAVDMIRFADGATWSIDDIKKMVMIGSDQADNLYGYATDDTINGGDDNDNIQGHAGNDTLSGDDGNDHLQGGQGNDTLDGGNGDDRLQGGQGNDHLKGQDGNDVLAGGPDDDILDGGIGQDQLSGGRGNDTYLFGRGYGWDSIDNAYYYAQRSEDIDTILFHADISTNDIIATRNSDDLLLRIRDTDDRLHVQHYFSQGGDSEYAVDMIRFADGATWSIDDVKKMVMIGSDQADNLYGYATDDTISGGSGKDIIHGRAGNDLLKGEDENDQLDGGDGNDVIEGGNGEDRLSGGAGNDTLDGGSGNDYLTGGHGDDIYLFGVGSGKDVIAQYDSGSDDKDSIRLTGTITEEHIWLSQSGGDLLLSLTGSDDSMTIRDWYRNDRYRLQELKLASGKKLLRDDVDQLVQAMAKFDPPSAIDTAIPSQYMSDLRPVMTAVWR